MANHTLIRGDTKVWVLSFTTAAGSAYPLTGCSVWLTVKKNGYQTDDDAPIAHYWSEDAEDGISLTDPDTGIQALLTDGVLYHAFPADETTELEVRVYRYDIQFANDLGEVTTIMRGSIVVSADVTRRVTVP